MAGFIDLARIQSLIMGSKHHLVKDAGHLIPMERPREVARIIGEFFFPHTLLLIKEAQESGRKVRRFISVRFRRDREQVGYLRLYGETAVQDGGPAAVATR